MSNKAKNSKESILCDAKELMKLYDRVAWHLPKARREHSAVRRFEDAGYAIIHYCTIAMELKGENEQQRKREYVEHLIGSFGEMVAVVRVGRAAQVPGLFTTIQHQREIKHKVSLKIKTL